MFAANPYYTPKEEWPLVPVANDGASYPREVVRVKPEMQQRLDAYGINYRFSGHMDSGRAGGADVAFEGMAQNLFRHIAVASPEATIEKWGIHAQDILEVAAAVIEHDEQHNGRSGLIKLIVNQDIVTPTHSFGGDYWHCDRTEHGLILRTAGPTEYLLLKKPLAESDFPTNELSKLFEDTGREIGADIRQKVTRDELDARYKKIEHRLGTVWQPESGAGVAVDSLTPHRTFKPAMGTASYRSTLMRFDFYR